MSPLVQHGSCRRSTAVKSPICAQSADGEAQNFEHEAQTALRSSRPGFDVELAGLQLDLPRGAIEQAVAELVLEVANQHAQARRRDEQRLSRARDCDRCEALVECKPRDRVPGGRRERSQILARTTPSCGLFCPRPPHRSFRAPTVPKSEWSRGVRSEGFGPGLSCSCLRLPLRPLRLSSRCGRCPTPTAVDRCHRARRYTRLAIIGEHTPYEHRLVPVDAHTGRFGVPVALQPIGVEPYRAWVVEGVLVTFDGRILAAFDPHNGGLLWSFELPEET